MTLTPKQEKFSQCVADGMTQADAYRAAYSAGAMKPETVQQTASRLMNDRKVSARVTELRRKLEEKGLWTREQSVEVLRDIAQTAKPGERVSAVKELNAMHGFNEPTKLNLSGAVATRIELVALE